MSGTEFIEGAIQEMHVGGPLATLGNRRRGTCGARCPKCTGAARTCERAPHHNGLHLHRETRFTTDAHSWGAGR